MCSEFQNFFVSSWNVDFRGLLCSGQPWGWYSITVYNENFRKCVNSLLYSPNSLFLVFRCNNAKSPNFEKFETFWRYLREFSSVFDVFGCFGKPMSRRNFYFWIYEKIFIFKKVRAQNFLCDIFHNSIFENNFYIKKNVVFEISENFRKFSKFGS